MMVARCLCVAVCAGVLLLPGAAAGSTETEDVVLMNPEWARLACAAWNEAEELTQGLSQWASNDKDRGFKIIQLYRKDCAESVWVELKIVSGDGGSECVFGGERRTEDLDFGADYIMNATTEHWLEMGAGDYGPMKGMLTGRLKFKGPHWEAMRNMGPFKRFLLLVGEVPGEAVVCPP